MKQPKALSMDAFDYDLPDERVARYPLPERDQSKLLQYRAGQISDHLFVDLPTQLPAGSLLIGNRTRVIHARLRLTLPNEKTIEVFCLDPVEPVDYQLSLSSREGVRWKCLVGGNRKWKSGEAELVIPREGSADLSLSMQRIERVEGGAFLLDFRWSDPLLSFGEVLHLAGQIPLPPYLGRPAEVQDQNRYQTVFAKTEGSVAAPTAGLHFTPRVLAQLKEQGCQWEEIVLHVGAGTFKPVSSPTLAGHEMHREYIEVERSFLEKVQQQLEDKQPIICVGTTSLRCLESCYYLGRELAHTQARPDEDVLFLDQWTAIDSNSAMISPAAAIQALIEHLNKRGLSQLRAYTQLLIAPGMGLQIADGLITNFHQPRSTLLLIIAAVTADDWTQIYDHALANDYRFLSYGDSSLLWN
ncbi:MAG: S-adenosylmethionine:tRNA ribosyltransferase-isomerase [Bacteroidota bacterium]